VAVLNESDSQPITIQDERNDKDGVIKSKNDAMVIKDGVIW
jgi:hypothetical protein